MFELSSKLADRSDRGLIVLCCAYYFNMTVILTIFRKLCNDMAVSGNYNFSSCFEFFEDQLSIYGYLCTSLSKVSEYQQLIENIRHE